MTDEKKLFKSEEQKNLADAANMLRKLADEVEQGKVMLHDGANEVTLNLPQNLSVEQEVEEEMENGKTKRSLEIELEWIEEHTEKQE